MAGAFFLFSEWFQFRTRSRPRVAFHTNFEYTMNEALPTTGKILRGTEGVGTVTPQMIEERAREIARTDGRLQVNDVDRSRAREDLTGPTSDSEKLPTTEEPGRDWQMPLVSTGDKAPTVRPEDDENIVEKLVQEGIDEADHDQRLSSERNREK
jgi:hypothetical protein